MNPLYWTNSSKRGFFMKFSKNEILSAVRLVLEEKHTLGQVSKEIGISKKHLRRYVDKVRYHGYDCLPEVTYHKTYNGEFKQHVVEFIIKNQLSIYSAAVKFNLTDSMVRRWKIVYLEEGKEALYKDKRGRKIQNGKLRGKHPKLDIKVKEDLIVENKRLKMENDYLKKLSALIQKLDQSQKKK